MRCDGAGLERRTHWLRGSHCNSRQGSTVCTGAGSACAGFGMGDAPAAGGLVVAAGINGSRNAEGRQRSNRGNAVGRSEVGSCLLLAACAWFSESFQAVKRKWALLSPGRCPQLGLQ